jgi:hypothetical protein
MMDSHLLRTRTKSKSASTVFKKEELRDAGINSSHPQPKTGEKERDTKERDRETKDRDSNNPPSPRDQQQQPPSGGGSAVTTSGQLIPGFVPEEWKYGRVQQDSIKEGTLTCLLCH